MSFSAYSDEIAQALHLFPFYPLPLSAAKAPTAFVILLYILYPRPVPAVKTKRPVRDVGLSEDQLMAIPADQGNIEYGRSPLSQLSLLIPKNAPNPLGAFCTTGFEQTVFRLSAQIVAVFGAVYFTIIVFENTSINIADVFRFQDDPLSTAFYGTVSEKLL